MENEKKPKNRFLRLLSVFAVVLLLAFVAVPAFAAGSEDYTVSGLWRFHEVLIPYGELEIVYEEPINFTFVSPSEQFGEVLFNCSGFRFYNIAFNGGEFQVLVNVKETSPSIGLELPKWLYVYGNAWNNTLNPVVDFGDVPQEVSSELYFWLVRNAVPVNSFRDSVTSGLTVVIDWVGTVVSSLFSGELSGLLPIVAIPVAVTLLVLAIYFIRRSIWGA